MDNYVVPWHFFHARQLYGNMKNIDVIKVGIGAVEVDVVAVELDSIAIEVPSTCTQSHRLANLQW